MFTGPNYLWEAYTPFNDTSICKTRVVYTRPNKMQIHRRISATSDYLFMIGLLPVKSCVISGQSSLTWTRQLPKALSASPEPSFTFADITTKVCLPLAVMTDASQTYQKLIFIGF